MYPFKSIKVLNNKVEIKPAKITDTDGNEFYFKGIGTKKAASPEMNDALQLLVPIIGERYNWPKKNFDYIHIQGVTFKEKEGTGSAKIHFSYFNPDKQFSPLNTTSDFILEKNADFDDIDNDDKYLNEEEVAILKNLIDATKEFIKIKPAIGQLSFFELPEPEKE